ncbi:MAG: hypothetical protein SFU98_21130 [Leptospiraceae bacterium]|nr:hypothetical protein [Leptospiraceae bacterium]
MKSISLILFSFLIFIFQSCSFCREEMMDCDFAPKEFVTGWRGSPENLEEKPFDYYYKKQYAIGSKRFPMHFKKNCIDSATIHSKGDLIYNIVEESVLGVSDIENDLATIIVSREYFKKIKTVGIIECNPVALVDPNIRDSEWAECRCIIFVHFPKGKDGIIKRVMEIQKE